MDNGKVFIDSLMDSDGGLSQTAIKKIIPYDDDFLFVTRIRKLSTKEVEAEYYIQPKLIYLKSHFVGFPIMPGVLISEGFAQAGTILIRYNLKNSIEKDILVCKVEEGRFSSPAFPGETLIYKVDLKTLGSRAARLAGQVLKDNHKIATFSVVLSIVDRKSISKK